MRDHMVALSNFTISESDFFKTSCGCWVWLGAKDKYGYGTRRIGGRGSNKNWFAHRLSYRQFVGGLEPHLQINHKCNNKYCINPDHLYQGTQADNMRDVMKDGVARKPKPALQGNLHPGSKLTEKDVLEIRKRYKPRVVTAKSLAKEYGVSYSTIRHIIDRSLWAYV